MQINKQSQTPIYEQFIEQMETGILLGTLPVGEPLPSVRALASSLGVNPNTLQKAYAEMERRGLCYTVPGTGRMLTEDAKARVQQGRRGRLAEAEQLFRTLKECGVTETELLASVHRIYEGREQA